MIPSHETILYSCSNDTKNWNFITGNLESLTPGNWTFKACDEPGLDYRCTNPADERSIKIMDATQTAASVGLATLSKTTELSYVVYTQFFFSPTTFNPVWTTYSVYCIAVAPVYAAVNFKSCSLKNFATCYYAYI